MLSRQVMTQLELRLNLKALHASEAFSRTVMESSPDCVKVLDLSGRILHMNGEGCRQMEIDDFSVCRNQNWLDFWRGAEREAAAAALEAARAGGKGEFSGYCPTMKGMPRYWNVALAPILDEGGDPVQLICSSRDITDRRLTEEKLQDAAKLESLGVMAGGIAHDFNNLLTGILGFASVLAEAVSPRDRHMTDHIISAAERAADLTRQLLAYSGKGQFEIRAVDLSAELRDMLRIIEPIVENNIRLSLELDDHLPSLNGDPEQIRQLVINLVVNASEAMNGRPGTITLRTAPVPSGEISSVPYVLLEVCDNGCGMDEETRARIFDPFFTTKFVGRGLGLAAVSGIVRGHNGILRVESEVGKGTIFRVFFPAVVSAQPEPELPTETKDIIGRGTVLIVDDEEMVRKVGKTALERAGYEVRLASDGREAVEMFSAEPEAYSLILLDMTMPVMNGEEALGLLREIRPDVPVIVSSGYNEAEVLRHFPSGALAAFIQKPYSASRLADRVDSVLAERAQLATSAS
jgi:PAS domain S-box-containing protein